MIDESHLPENFILVRVMKRSVAAAVVDAVTVAVVAASADDDAAVIITVATAAATTIAVAATFTMITTAISGQGRFFSLNPHS